MSMLDSAHWCPPCAGFTPKLAAAYKQATADTSFDIVFVSSDEDQSSFDEYYKEMPWKAIPFEDRNLAEKLGEKYEIEGIPSLIILKPNGTILTTDGVAELTLKGSDAIGKWAKGQSIFWSRAAQPSEYTWEDIACENCNMKPIIGDRYVCVSQCENYDICHDCKQKTVHEHDLIKYLIPSEKYSLKELLSGDGNDQILLLDKNNQKVTLDSLKNKYLGLYFSAHWCPPCRYFTPELTKLYNEAIDANLAFDIIFVSSDEDKESFENYFNEMPWKALPYENRTIKNRLAAYYNIEGIPSLIIIKPSGETLTKKGRRDIGRSKLRAIEAWSHGESVKHEPIKPEEHNWGTVTCDGCKMDPLIGLRYYCSTCGNYDLCQSCKDKGHEHELKLIDIPEDDDDDE
ncbi:unnamed protein product [Didymodactylos carnosus]|uniref:protein-disulfide reductase n=1 Tax=Didymodactylos carnosus TaxID=1234261 RepID=A0A815AF38_9BILA|nr:unnamed protein product [Didymodactylos carnosus]CAF4024921.1 unnamed protein product [Didymodactylos carnosus]